PGAGRARRYRRARAGRTPGRTTGSGGANPRRSRPPARVEAAAGTDPRARTGRPASGPTPSPAAVAEPRADPATAAATSSVNSDSNDTQARQPEPRAARSPQPT